MKGKGPDYVFEVSWEICNKVGGIYAVVKSKAPSMSKHYQDRYFLVGPYFQDKAVMEFREEIPPDDFLPIFDGLKEEGIICRYGKWIMPGEPITILVDYNGYTPKNYEIKTSLWKDFQIDSLGSKFHDFDEPIIWSTAVGRFLDEFSKSDRFGGKDIVAHMHEWLSCGALFYLKQRKSRVATVFTTHATMLGRTMASNDIDIYQKLDRINADEEAYNWKVHLKHQVEKASAKNADVFTTVSEITALEVQQFFGKKPDLILYNGIDMEGYPSQEELSIKHRSYRERIREFLQCFLFPYYSFDLDNTLLFFISGRYEFHNKGVDLFIKALSRLNEKLKKEKSEKTIAVFVWIPRDVIRIKPEVAQAKVYYEDIEESVNDNLEDIKRRIIQNIISKRKISKETLLSKDFLLNTEKRVMRFLKSSGNPPLCTHDLQDEDNDLIIKSFREHGLLNREEDRVKIIFYPIYLTGADGLLDLDYEQSIIGSHLGVFPSYYEPWGYTPLETGALAVAAVTTDLGGFGRYISHYSKKDYPGIFVIEIFKKSEKGKVDNLYRIIYQFTKLSKEERIKNKLEAHRLASMIDWSKLVKNYLMAHEMAINRMHKNAGPA